MICPLSESCAVGSAGFTGIHKRFPAPRKPQGSSGQEAEAEQSRGPCGGGMAHRGLSPLFLQVPRLNTHACPGPCCLAQHLGCTKTYYLKPEVPWPWGGGMQAVAFPMGSLEEGDLQ